MAKTGKAAGAKPGKGGKAVGTGKASKAPTVQAAKGHPAPARQAVVVLTMHRSGSSALSRILNLLGCDLPRTLMGGDASNETGHWESTVVRALNDDLLASGGSDWQDWHAFNPAWYDTARPGEFLTRAHEVLEAEYGRTALMVLKDPRICRIFPFWREALETAGIDPRVILTLRHPVEVAASLQRRNAIPEAQGLLLWLRHVLEAEWASRGMVRAVISYDQLLTRPVEVMRAAQAPLGLIWPRLSENTAAEITGFVAPDLRHHEADPQALSGLAFSDWLRTVHGVLLRWSETGEDRTDWPALDAVRAAMGALATPLREVMTLLARQAADLATMDKDVRYLRGEAGKRGDSVAALTAEKKALTEALDRQKDAQAAMVAEQETLRLALAEAQAEAQAAREAERAEADALRAEAGRQKDAQAAMAAEQETLRLAMAAEQETLRLALAEAQAEAQAAREAERAEADALRAEVGRQKDAQAAMAAEQEALRLALAEAQAESQAAREAERDEAANLRAAAEAARDQALADLAELRTELGAERETLNREIGFLRGEAGKRGDAVAALTTEKETLTKALAAEREALAAARETGRKETGEARAEAERLRADLADLADRQAEAAAAFDAAERTGLDLREELGALTTRLAEAENARQADSQRLAEEMAVLIEQNMSQADQLAEAATRQAVREQAHLADLAALQAELEAREVALAEAEDAREAALAEAEDARAQLENSLSETQSALRQRQHEADETAAALKATRQQLQEAETGLAEMRKAQGEAHASLEALRRKAENDGAARYDEIAELTRTLIEREAHLAAQATRLHSVNAAYAEVNNTAERLRQEIAAQEVAVTNLRAEIDRRGAAIGHLMGLAEEGRRLSDRIGQAIDALLRQAERPWLRGRRQLARKAALLRASGLFDAEWYGAAHPDVTAAGQDPATHFILFGRAEGRHPLPDLARFLAGLPANPASRTEEPGSAP